MRILYILPGLVPPPKDVTADQAFHLPAPLEGDILLPVWSRDAQELRDALGPASYPEHRVGNFSYRFYLSGKHKLGGPPAKLGAFAFFLREGLRCFRRRKYDCILTYGWTLTGLAGLVLARLTGAKLIVGIMNIPENAYKYNGYGDPYVGIPRQTVVTRFAKRVSDLLLHLVVGRADCARLVYPTQLAAYPRLSRVPTFTVPDFVPMRRIPPAGGNDGSVLLVGAPWYVKGVDLLIRAFRSIETEFPNTRLRLLGHFPGQDFKDLIGDSDRIEVLKARPHAETLEMIANCGVLALASRTDALPRVLFEAMAAGKPVVAPKVGGIPHYIHEEVNGLLFEREDVAGLAAQLRRLLASPDLQARLGRNGLELARARYTEAEIGRQILEMIRGVVEGAGRATLDAQTAARKIS